MKALRAKSEKLTGYLERLLIERCGDKVAILTPPEPAERGCQLSIRLQDGKQIHERLIASGVTCDLARARCDPSRPGSALQSFRGSFRFRR